MKFEYYQDKEGNAYELKTDLEQLLVHDMSEQGEEIERLENIIKEVREKIKNHLYAKTILSDMYSDNEIFEFILEKTGDIDEQR